MVKPKAENRNDHSHGSKVCHQRRFESQIADGFGRRRAGAFIGRVHATAAVLDNRAVLVAGRFPAIRQRAKASAADYDIRRRAGLWLVSGIDRQGETLPADKRIDFVSIATPNHTHFEIAKAAVEAGFNVICDKPLTLDLDTGRTVGRGRR